jgi:hypothetical protein
MSSSLLGLAIGTKGTLNGNRSCAMEGPYAGLGNTSHPFSPPEMGIAAWRTNY